MTERLNIKDLPISTLNLVRECLSRGQTGMASELMRNYVKTRALPQAEYGGVQVIPVTPKPECLKHHITRHGKK